MIPTDEDRAKRKTVRDSGTLMGLPAGSRNSTPGAMIRPLPALGSRIGGKYLLNDILGTGAMGVVYDGEDETLRRAVAVKFVKPNYAVEPVFCERFMEEARAMAAVQHPNVVEIYAFGTENEVPYFVMEKFPGTNLAAYLAERGGDGLSLDEGLGLLDQICRGVAAIHAAGVIHRDIKPSNIVLGHGFRVAVADFGLAQAQAGDQHALAVGTRGYMAPEAFEGSVQSVEIAQRRDVFSIAAVAYELFAGVRAFGPDGAGEPIPLGDLRPDLPEELVGAIELALLDDPALRTPTPMELRRQLLGAQAKARVRADDQLRFVVVDDDSDFLLWLRTILTEAFPRAAVVTSIDGRRALEALESPAQTLLITDLDMPLMDGLRVTAEARRARSNLPIMVLTGHGSARDWKRLKAVGADVCALKPLDPETLVALVRVLLAKHPA